MPILLGWMHYKLAIVEYGYSKHKKIDCLQNCRVGNLKMFSDLEHKQRHMAGSASGICQQKYMKKRKNKHSDFIRKFTVKI
jgi:hypothetical protein